jgi:hypothetical protein
VGNRSSVAALVAALAAALIIALTTGPPNDYGLPSCRADPMCDDGAPATDALARGDVGAFFREQRPMGPVSQVLRAPFVAVAGGDRIQRYRAGLVPCLIALALVGGMLAELARRRGRAWWFQLLVAVGALVNPVTLGAVHWGHPEDLLAAALLAGGGLAAWRGRATTAGACIGLAVATKLWALAGVPVLLLAVAGPLRSRAAVTAAVAAGALIATTAVGSPGTFGDNLDALGRLGSAPGTVSVPNVWWPFADTTTFQAPVATAGGQVLTVPATGYSLPRSIGRLAHALVLLAGALVALLWLRRRSDAGEYALLALALALLLRCVLDPGTISYYHAPFVIALVAYEALVRRTLPWLSLGAVGSFELLSHTFARADSRGTFNAAYLVWSLGLATLLAAELAAGRSRGSGTRAPVDSAN